MDTNNKLPMDVVNTDDSFSSNTHPTLLFGEEAKEFALEDEFKIPLKYEVGYLRLLPVNVNTVFTYWEITDSLIANVTDNFESFVLKLLDESENKKEIISFYFKDKLSSRYINAYMPSKSLIAVIGVMDTSGNFHEILRSNKISMPSDIMTESQEEEWMSKKSDWMELIRASVSHFSHAKSSISIVKEMEFLKKYGQKSVSGMSSSELVKKD
ncbi:MAG: DUF4912 domain-containing protein [Campylobacterales bacterium]|nr:DUF4912 domain-containing protein [Campylobacterales bacterium]